MSPLSGLSQPVFAIGGGEGPWTASAWWEDSCGGGYWGAQITGTDGDMWIVWYTAGARPVLSGPVGAWSDITDTISSFYFTGAGAADLAGQWLAHRPLGGWS